MPLAASGLDPKSKQRESTRAQLDSSTWGQDHGTPQTGPLLHLTHPGRKGPTNRLVCEAMGAQAGRRPPASLLLPVHLLPAVSQVRPLKSGLL